MVNRWEMSCPLLGCGTQRIRQYQSYYDFWNNYDLYLLTQSEVARRWLGWMVGGYCVGLTSSRPRFRTEVPPEVGFRQEKS